MWQIVNLVALVLVGSSAAVPLPGHLCSGPVPSEDCLPYDPTSLGVEPEKSRDVAADRRPFTVGRV